MEYFRRLLDLLKIEKEEDRRSYKELLDNLGVNDRRAAGLTWYPIAIRDTEIGHGDYLTIEVERTTNQDVIHQFRFGMSAALFSNHDAKNYRVEGTITYAGSNRLKISLRTYELPDWSRNGKLGVDIVFDENSYAEMENSLKLAMTLSQNKDRNRVIKILTGEAAPTFDDSQSLPDITNLNQKQQEAVGKILSSNELAIVHGPPGTGKTTTLVQAIKSLVKKDREKVLVTAPSNAAVDLLTEKLSEQELNVVRVGNPAKVSERQMSLTLDNKMSSHPMMKEIKRLKKQAAEYKDMAHKYKRSFGYAEREQRKALFAEAKNITKEVDKTEDYITEDILAKADVVTATLVGANHYSVRNRRYNTVVIDEAGQALEPACWIPILKAEKLVMAGDHCQLPPTIKSAEAAKELGVTLMEKCVAKQPASVVLLEEQYRMHKDIMQFSSSEFYEGRLKASRLVADELMFDDDKPVFFIDTAGSGYEEKREGSRISNPEEAAFLIRHLTDYSAKLKTVLAPDIFPSIAVISPYKQQVELLKELLVTQSELKVLSEYISVNTIDSFQGQERDAVFISLVRSNADSSIGFLSEIRRMNVAMTRARKKLVVIGDSSTISQFPFYADFIAYVQQKDSYTSIWELMEF